jgi:hypothetical protein
MSEDVFYAGGRAEARADAVAEIAGLHGAFTFPELLLQRIWWRGDFDARALRTRDGRVLRLKKRGRWNRLGGPDFADAEIEIGEGAQGEVLRGAVEVHLRAVDWDQHGHSTDPAYAGVVLHVVLFPSTRVWTAGVDGRRIPILELLPLLERDLESYAEEAAVEGIAGRPYSQLREILSGIAPAKLRVEVARHAEWRWGAKVGLARARIERLGWEAACHHAALEVLGYRFNRAPMLEIAERWPLAEWRKGVAVESVFESQAGEWRVGGVRPANRPRLRLAQYAEWVAVRPDWPERLAGWGGAVGNVPTVGRSRMAERKILAETVCGGVLGGSRFDTWVCDAALPLLAARFGEEEAKVGFKPRWLAWKPGDAPAELLRLAREFEIAGEGGVGVRQGELQGLLGWLAALVARAGVRAGRGA